MENTWNFNDLDKLIEDLSEEHNRKMIRFYAETNGMFATMIKNYCEKEGITEKEFFISITENDNPKERL